MHFLSQLIIFIFLKYICFDQLIIIDFGKYYLPE